MTKFEQAALRYCEASLAFEKLYDLNEYTSPDEVESMKLRCSDTNAQLLQEYRKLPPQAKAQQNSRLEDSAIDWVRAFSKVLLDLPNKNSDHLADYQRACTALCMAYVEHSMNKQEREGKSR